MSPARATFTQTEERVECCAGKEPNISTQPVTPMDHSGNTVCSVHNRPLCQFNPKCCVHKPREANCSCSPKYSCCCLHHFGDCCFCVCSSERKGRDAGEFEKTIVPKDITNNSNDAMVGNDAPNQPKTPERVEEHKPSDPSDGNKASDEDKSSKDHTDSNKKTAIDHALSPCEVNKSWDEMVAEEEEGRMVSGNHVLDPEKPIKPKETVAEKADLGFDKTAEETEPNKRAETPDGDTDEETIKPANSVVLEEVMPSENTAYPDRRNDPGETIEPGQPKMAADKFEAGETVEPEVTSKVQNDTPKVEGNGHCGCVEKREESSSGRQVGSTGVSDSAPASAPLTEANGIGKNQDTTGQIDAGECLADHAPSSIL